jgi:hypothetical protein
MSNHTQPERRARLAPCLVLCLSALGVVGPAVATEGASAPTVAPGTRVRVETSGPVPTEVIGTINAMDDRSIRLDVEGQARPLELTRDRITRFQVSAGRRSRLAHALVGALVGAAAGSVAVSHSGGPHYPSTNATATLVVALVGSGIGAALPAGERWTDVPATHFRAALMPCPGSCLRIAFSHGL